MNDNRLTDIESKIAFQENIIKDLSDTVYDQQKQLDKLNETLKLLSDQIRESSLISPRFNPKDEKPPHY